MQYNSTLFDPPCPVLDVVAEAPISSARQARILAQVDTGADVCVIPNRLVTELGLIPYRRNEFEKHDGTKEWKTVYRIVIAINGVQPFMADCVYFPFVDADDYMVLGREGLNQLRLLLEGPRLQLTVL